MTKILFITLICSVIISLNSVCGQQYRTSLDIRIPAKTSVTHINGQPTLYYELHITNFGKDTIIVNRLEILTSDNTIILSIPSDEMRNRVTPIGVSVSDDNNTLPPGGTSVIYLEPVLQNESQTSLTHRLEIKTKQGIEIINCDTTAFPRQIPIMLGAPLRSGPWVAIYEPSWERGHRRVFYTVNGKARIPGRWAIDFIKVDEQGLEANGDRNIVKNWYGYNADVFAVADGIVLSVKDSFPESPTLSDHPGYPSEKATGNYISLAMKNDLVAFYEHLKPGSIKVKPGQQVKKGDIIASLGFTGSTTGPHLHFHVANANSPLGAEGIPFTFEKFILLGGYPDFKKYGKEPWSPLKSPDQQRTNERPYPNAVIKFEN